MLTKIVSSKGMIWGAVSILYTGLLLYTGYYTFLSNNEFATDENKLKIVLGNIGYNVSEKNDIAEHIVVLLTASNALDTLEIAPISRLQNNLMDVTGEYNSDEVIKNIQHLFSIPDASLFEESQIDAIIGQYLEYQKTLDLNNETLKGTRWFTDKDGETQIHLTDVKKIYAHDLVKREAESFSNVNSLATQSFTIVLGALLGFLSASLSDTQNSEPKDA